MESNRALLSNNEPPISQEFSSNPGSVSKGACEETVQDVRLDKAAARDKGIEVVSVEDVQVKVIESEQSFESGGGSQDKINGDSTSSEVTDLPEITDEQKTRRLLINRKSSSDGAAKVMETVKGETERTRRCSENCERTMALKGKINQMYDSLHQEMQEKYSMTARIVSDLDDDSDTIHTCCLNDPDGTAKGSIRTRCRSVAEVKEKAYSRLQEELHKAQQELKLKDEEVARLSQIRDQVGSELEDLTATLFEEANNMVQNAMMKQAHAEKQLAEANMKIEGLMAEVQALKTLVITSTPSMPNRHLHPQLENLQKPNGVRSIFRTGHRRSPSNYELASTVDTPPGSPVKEQPPATFPQESHEYDPFYHQEFVLWRQNPVMDKSHPFLSRIYQQDIMPCLQFQNQDLTEQVLKAIEDNSIIIEAVSGKSPFPKRCTLLEAPRLCKYKMKLGESAEWHYISQLGRNRIIAVCDFFCYLRYIQQGLVKNGIHEVYWEVIRRRQEMALARLGVFSQ